jgi:two-component system sensor histidine kinase UhpB
MIRYLHCLLACMPLFAVSQTVNDRYLEQKLDEARQYHQQFEHNKSMQVLDALYAQSVKEQNDFAAALSLIKKTHYTITNGGFASGEPDWTEIEKFTPKDVVRQNIQKLHLLKLKATWYQSTGKNYPEAFRLLDEGIQLAERTPDCLPVLAEIWYLYGQLKSKNSQYVEANAGFLKALRIYDQLNDEASAGRLYGELASTSFLMGEKERAIDYAGKGIAIIENKKDYEELIVQLSNLARMYQMSGDIENAIKYFSKSAEYVPRSAKKETKFISLVDLSLVYHVKKDRENALKYMEQAIAEGRKIEQPKLHRYIRMGAMFAGYTGNEDLMNRYYDESYSLALNDNDRDALRDWYGSLNFYHAQVKNDKAKAYPFLEKFHAYKDSIINEKSRKDFNELEVQYQTEKKQAEINKLATEQKIQQLELEKKNALLRGYSIEAAQKEKEIQLLTQEQIISNLKIEQQAKSLSLHEAEVKNLEQTKWIAAQENLIKEEKIQNEQLKRNLVIVLLLIAVILFLFILNRTLLKKKLDQKNLLLKERSRISAELHDEVGSTLTAINLLSYSTINQLHEAESKNQVKKIQENTQSVMENISDIVWSMNPQNDIFSQIVVRMKEFAANVLEPQQIQYYFSVDESFEKVKLSAEKRRDLYLVFKEAVNNMAKYSQATNTSIKLVKSAQYLQLIVKDDGIGFEADTLKKGNGLKNMKSRTERQQGVFEIKSNENGTTVTAQFPYA